MSWRETGSSLLSVKRLSSWWRSSQQSRGVLRAVWPLMGPELPLGGPSHSQPVDQGDLSHETCEASTRVERLSPVRLIKRTMYAYTYMVHTYVQHTYVHTHNKCIKSIFILHV